MSRHARGTFVTLNRERLLTRLKAMPCKDAVLLYLDTKENYRATGATAAELLEATGANLGTLRNTLAALVKCGELCLNAGRYSFPQPCTTACTDSCNESVNEPVQHAVPATPKEVEGSLKEVIPTKPSPIPFMDPPEWRESATSETLSRLEQVRLVALSSDPSAREHVRAIRQAGADLWREFVKLGVLAKAADVTLASWAQAMSADLERHGKARVLEAIRLVQANPPEKRSNAWRWYRDEIDGTKPARVTSPQADNGRSVYDAKPLERSEHEAIRQRVLKLAGEAAA